MTALMRAGTMADMPAVLGLLYTAHAEIKPMAISEPKTRGYVAHVFQHGMVIVVEQDAKIIATGAMVAESPWWSNEIGLDSVWLYVMPEHRRTPHATALLRAMRDYGRKVGLPVHAGFMARPDIGRRVNTMRRLYERVFGEPVGMSFYSAGGAP